MRLTCEGWPGSKRIRRDARIIEEYEKYVMPTYGRQPVVFVRGEGCYLYDEDGQGLSRFRLRASPSTISGTAIPAVVKAVQRPGGELIHTCNLYYTEPGGELARADLGAQPRRQGLLFQLAGPRPTSAPSSWRANTATTSGGADKHRIITLENGFHGRTMATLTATAQPEKQAPFKPLLPGFMLCAGERHQCA